MKNLLRKLLPSRFLFKIRVIKNIYYSPFEREIEYLLNSKLNFDVSIDVGANIGFYSYVLSKKSKLVIAFEPIDELAKYLNAVLPKNCAVQEYALSDSRGSSNIRIPVRSDTGVAYALATIDNANKFQDEGEIQVIEKTILTYVLDEYIDENLKEGQSVDFIKIDVEGHELKVLKGASHTIDKYRPIIQIETELRHGADVKNIFDQFDARGYKSNRIEKHEICPINYDNFIATQKNYSKTQSGYINNIIFIPNEKWYY